MSSSGLPAHLFETYAFYKKNTSFFIRWLSMHNKGTKERSSITSVKELICLADSVIEKQVPVPVDVFLNLEKVIRARTRVSRFFKTVARPENQEAHLSHEFFTRALQQIHGDLREMADKCKSSTRSESANLFEYLHWDKSLEDEEEAQPVDHGHTPVQRITTESCCPNQSGGSEKDSVGEFMAISLYLFELDQLGITVKNSWQRAANGKIPVVLAASTNNLVHISANAVEKHLAEYGIHHPDHLFERYHSCLHSLNLSGSMSTAPEVPLLKGLEETWQVLKDFKVFWGTPGAQEKLVNLDNRQFRQTSRSGPFPFDDPTDFMMSGERESQAEADGEYLRVVLMRMAQMIVKDSKYLPGPLDRLPLLRDFASFVFEIKNARILSLNFGLRMLVESTHSYLKAVNMNSPRTSSKSCRVQSLKFTGDVKRNIECTMAMPLAPCGCFEIGGENIQNSIIGWQKIFYKFVEIRRFDLYYQSPWTSGSHMARTLTNASLLGSQVWHYGYYVGTVLHIYHSLIALKSMSPDEIPLFENLCNIFERQLFLARRPSRNISSCYQRWVGSVIKFPKGRCHSLHSHIESSASGSDKKWKMKYIQDKSHGGDNQLRYYDPAKLSLFYILMTENYMMYDKILACAYCSKNCEKIREKDIKEAWKKAEAEPFVARSVELIQDTMLKEFEGELPVARINYFAVYRVCLKILKALDAAEHPKNGPYEMYNCATIKLFRFADECIDNDRLIENSSHRHLIKNCRETLLSAMENMPLTEFLWQV